MKLTVLGCSGGIGAGLATTALLVDNELLIDAGTGVGELSIDAMSRIDHVFVSHCHLDHVCSIPFLVDAVGRRRNTPLFVHGLEETIQAMRSFLFNGQIWPDFTLLPRRETPWLSFRAFEPGHSLRLGSGIITALPANHTVAAAGFCLDSGAASLVFTGDTGPCDALWDAVNAIGNLRYLIVETAFSERERNIALASGHLCPSLLAAELAKLRSRPEVFITHLKPCDGEAAMTEIATLVPGRRPVMLRRGHVLEF
jgi:ribonuclease BN (tRNA processing enzyme)